MESLLQQALLYQAVNSFTAHSRPIFERGAAPIHGPRLVYGPFTPARPPNEFGV